jgi:peptide deformylase
MVLPVRLYPDPVLERVCRKIDTNSAPDWFLIDGMVGTMRSNNGIGLAANQVGRDIAIFVMQDSGMPAPLVIANPSVTGEQLTDMVEGCLSLPGLAAKVPRFLTAKLKCHVASSYDNKWIEEELQLHGTAAQCVQHETDHLNGILYIDRLDKATRDLLLSKFASQAS